MSKSVLEVIREVEQILKNIDWMIEAPAPSNFAAEVGRALGTLQVLRIDLEIEQKSKLKIAALKAIQERI